MGPVLLLKNESNVNVKFSGLSDNNIFNPLHMKRPNKIVLDRLWLILGLI